jgi:hypothetical protein
VTQAVAVAAAGRWSVTLVELSLPLCPIALLALTAGYRLQRRIRPNDFLIFLRGVLWLMAAVLCEQAIRAYLR